MENPQLKLGMIFSSPQVFRQALVEWTVRQGYDIKYLKNENKRITVVCKFDYGFRIHASPMQGEKTFQIKTFKPKHTCGMKFKSHLVTSSYIANKYQQRMSDNPKWSIPAMQKELRRELKVDLSKDKLFRAKRKAADNISGAIRVQYTKLRDYCVTVQKYNPNTIIFVATQRLHMDRIPYFQRLHVCYKAQKVEFVSGCRPIIGLHRCFLKGIYGGQVLAAIGRDGNENMVPIAMAVVEAENMDSWTRFLKSLIDDIGDGGDMGLDFYI